MTGGKNFEMKIQLNDEWVTHLEEIIADKSDVPPEVVQELQQKTISVHSIKLLHSVIKDENIRLHEMLSDCDILLPAPVPEPRNPELEERIQRLKAQIEDQKYRDMVRNVSAKKERIEDSIGYQLKYMNRQLIAVGQFIFSVAAGFAFGFFGLPLLVGEHLDFGFRLLLGVICALIIALAEIYFLAKIIAEMDDDSELDSPKHQSHGSSDGKVHQD